MIFHCICSTSSLFIPLSTGEFSLLPCLGCCKQCCNEHWGACILLDHVFVQIYAQEWDCTVICSSILSFLGNLHTVLVYRVTQSRTWLKWLSSSSSILFSIVAVTIYISTNSEEGSLLSTLSSAFIVCGFSKHANWMKEGKKEKVWKTILDQRGWERWSLIGLWVG